MTKITIQEKTYSFALRVIALLWKNRDEF